MNRMWIGIVILLVILGLGVGLLGGSVAFFGEISQKVEEAGEYALAGNWSLAAEKAEICRQKWEQYHNFWASFTDHAPIEQIRLLFAQLELYEKQQLTVEFSVCCRSISQEAEAIQESHGIAWWSIL